MTVARLNLSHGTHESHREIIRHIREASSEIDRPIRIMGELQGPKIRLGEIEGDGVFLEEGQPFELLVTPITGNVHRANIDYPDISDIVSGSFILINDGTRLKIPALTDKDREDLAFLLEEGIDLIACSFIRQAAHLEHVRDFPGQFIETGISLTQMIVSANIHITRGGEDEQRRESEQQ